MRTSLFHRPGSRPSLSAWGCLWGGRWPCSYRQGVGLGEGACLKKGAVFRGTGCEDWRGALIAGRHWGAQRALFRRRRSAGAGSGVARVLLRLLHSALPSQTLLQLRAPSCGLLCRMRPAALQGSGPSAPTLRPWSAPALGRDCITHKRAAMGGAATSIRHLLEGRDRRQRRWPPA